jgi:hypothetical protein
MARQRAGSITSYRQGIDTSERIQALPRPARFGAGRPGCSIVRTCRASMPCCDTHAHSCVAGLTLPAARARGMRQAIVESVVKICC